MLPDPLHPIVVHFPIVLVVLLPLFAAGALVAIRRGAAPRRAWALPLTLAAALTLSAWIAIETGEAQEERVEEVVSEVALHTHEEAAERFLVLSGVLLLIAGAGLVTGLIGSSARLVATVGAVVLIGAGIQVGGSGGDLVYKHGAANAYVSPAPAQESGEAAGEASRPRRLAERDD